MTEDESEEENTRSFSAEEIELVVEGEGEPSPLPIEHVEYDVGDIHTGVDVARSESMEFSTEMRMSTEEMHARLTESAAEHIAEAIEEVTGVPVTDGGDDPSEMSTDEFLGSIEDHKDSRWTWDSHEGPPEEDGEEGEVYVDSTTGDIYVYYEGEWNKQESETHDPSEIPDDEEDAARMLTDSVTIDIDVDDLANPDFRPDATISSTIRKMAEMDREERPFRTDMRSKPGPGSGMLGVSEEPGTYDDPTYTTHEINASPEMTRALLDRIADEVEKREREGHEITELVLGTPQYKVLHAWAQEQYGQDAEYVLPVEDVTVVPGPMIHPVIDNRRMLMEALEDE